MAAKLKLENTGLTRWVEKPSLNPSQREGLKLILPPVGGREAEGILQLRNS
ncbi:MAG: hypothetical protein BroJett011_03120 [Chloroflexota bacterium]|nr:MAG: hypothetical protein BroJett011_03120 [Chloroflexota bacterium]